MWPRTPDGRQQTHACLTQFAYIAGVGTSLAVHNLRKIEEDLVVVNKRRGLPNTVCLENENNHHNSHKHLDSLMDTPNPALQAGHKTHMAQRCCQKAQHRYGCCRSHRESSVHVQINQHSMLDNLCVDACVVEKESGLVLHNRGITHTLVAPLA
jgi:hypothetical protein